MDTKDREDGKPRLQRLRQVPPDTGKFLALLAANAPAGEYLEIGSSAGCSTLWLAVACPVDIPSKKSYNVLLLEGVIIEDKGF